VNSLIIPALFITFNDANNMAPRSTTFRRNEMTQKIALITGASRGLGKNAALAMAARGIDVILTYQSKQAAAEEVVAEITAQGRKAVALQLDVADS
jgi:NAD(P)-dependent dehydrogenase (short-subunit alcohol dehydrogenase family)